MKNIKELGLELIELEGDLLLVDRDLNKGGDTKYYLNGFIGRLYSNPQYQSYDILDFDGTLLERVRIKSNEVPYRIIASTKPLEGLPLLVIEDEVDEDFEKYKDEVGSRYSHSLYQFSKDRIDEGYNKAKEAFKFTEEDMIEFSIWRSTTIFSEPLTPIGQFEKWKFLTKKELWIEVEEWSLAENITAKNQNVPKIVNNQIKSTYR